VRPSDSEREAGRPTAEQALEQVRRQAGAGARGRHRIYVGMAPGVGKTYAALEELQRRGERGTDVVVGYVETYGRPRTIEAIGDLEVIPRKPIEYRGVTLDEMDLDAVLTRQPDVVLVDEIAHTNAPGSRHEKRWMDADELLAAGITVVSTMNIQHIESLADIVERITGVKVRERVPDRVLDGADEVQLVDITPHALRQRIRHGNVYPPDRAEMALDGFFREGNLTALRQLVLRRLSNVVEEDLEGYMRDHEVHAAWPAGQAVGVVVDAAPATPHLIRRAWRSAQALGAPLIAIWVEPPSWGRSAPEERSALEEHLRLADDLGADVFRQRADDPAAAIIDVVRERNIETVFVHAERRTHLDRLLGRRGLVDRLLSAPECDVHVAHG
jgi:two-component system sensor histidine kinase KdpD